MAVFRVEKTKDYTVMSNFHLRDKNLSLKAKGLLSWMLSNDESWDYTVAGIVAVMKENKDAINSALCELEDYGYLVRKNYRDAHGRFDTEYVISEKPCMNYRYGKSVTENPQQINTNKINTNKENSLSKDKETKPPKKSYNDIFSAPENKDIKEALVKWVNVCKGRKINFQYRTLERWAKTLRDHASSDSKLAMAMVDQSIDNGWKDIYPIKKGYNTPPKKEAVSIPVSKEDKAKNADGSYVVY